ncbi:MAG: hypothetical protein ACX94B_13020 [Henriciella sp.]
MDYAENGWLFAIRDWHVVFMGGPRRQWWDWFCRPDMRHVLCFGWCEHAQVWVVVDTHTNGTRIRLIPDGAEFLTQLEYWKSFGITVLNVEARGSDDIRLKMGAWCVPVVASVTGIGAGALRPQGLYRKMLESGATPSFGSGDSSESQRT